MEKKDYTKFSNPIEKKEEVKSGIINEDVEQVVANPEKHGVVTDCVRLNVREAPSIDAAVVCEIDCSSDMIVYEEESTEDFYKVCTATGVEGFCMKKFITILP